jgi:hypothetical protein
VPPGAEKLYLKRNFDRDMSRDRWLGDSAELARLRFQASEAPGDRHNEPVFLYVVKECYVWPVNRKKVLYRRAAALPGELLFISAVGESHATLRRHGVVAESDPVQPKPPGARKLHCAYGYCHS